MSTKITPPNDSMYEAQRRQERVAAKLKAWREARREREARGQDPDQKERQTP